MNAPEKKFLWLGLWLGLGLWPAAAQTNLTTREFVGRFTNGPAFMQEFRITTLSLRTQALRLPPHLATNAAFTTTNLTFGTNGMRIRVHTNTYVYTNLVFDSFQPGTLPHLVWTNFIAHTNGRDMRIWSTRTHPANWPTNPPVATWNTNSLIWGLRGLTAISPSWEGQGAVGQVPLTALTRRHVYARGHGMAAEGFSTKFAGKKAWFLAADNSLVEARVKRVACRITNTQQEHRDYTILLLDRDLPETIEPMAVATMDMVNRFYLIPTQGFVPFPVFQTEQTGYVSTSVAPLTVNTWKGGDSGSPNMVPLPGELVFFSGRSTSGPTPAMQADMDELCRLEGLNPTKYQMRWVDLEKLTPK